MPWPVNTRTSAMMDEAQTIYGATITATQGSPNVGVGASAGTHDGEGVIDVTGADLDAIVSAMREVGFAAWHRTRAEGFTPHVHGVAYGEPGLSPAAADQIDDYLAGRNGLATNAPDDGPRDWVGRTWEDYLAGNPGAGGNPVFRGGQITIEDVVVLTGSLDPYDDILDGLDNRDDATTVTLTAGDEFYLYVGGIETSDGDVYSKVTWRLNALGHGVIALADSYDEDYTHTVPFGWTTLANLTLDSDTLALTATPASPIIGAFEQLDNGGLMLRITCVSGTVTLDWVCLQVEPPAGLLIIDGSHWSSWRTPALVPHTPAGAGVSNVSGDEEIFDFTETNDGEAQVTAMVSAAVAEMAGSDWAAIIMSPLLDGPFPANAEADAFVTGGWSYLPRPDNRAQGGVYSAFTGLQWGSWPDYRTLPSELSSLIEGHEVEIVAGEPVYEFADGSTVSVKWNNDGSTLYYADVINNPIPPEVATDFSPGHAGFITSLGGDTGAPDFSPLANIDPTTTITSFTDVPSPGVDFALVSRLDIFDGVTGFPRPDGWILSLGENVAVSYQARAFGQFDIRLQMPDFRYRINDWIRSPDALDTSDPEGGIVKWLRNRQRNDGLGGWSTPRSKGTSSRQLSLHNRGYE